MKTMEETGSDFTNSFRCLSRIHLPGCADFTATRSDVLQYLLEQCSTLKEDLKANQPKMEPRLVGLSRLKLILKLFIVYLLNIKPFLSVVQAFNKKLTSDHVR